ncbi:MarR family winged helix-turn-helix transcriptional regulator [Chloroflexota bacterium]
MRPSEIAEWTLKERHNITTLVDRLKRDGLVQTKHSTQDKRVVNVILTAKGRRVLKQATPVARGVVEQVMSSINKENIILLENMLGRLRKNSHDGLDKVDKLAQSQPD